MMDWLAGQTLRTVTGANSSDTLSLREVFEAIASVILSPEFHRQAPEYPSFSQYITGDSISEAARDVLRNLAGGTRTRRASAVLDGLGLLEGDKLAPKHSRYARTVLEKLENKPAGQVVNQAELLIRSHDQYYFEPERYRLEAQWLVVVLASLVHAGEIELAVTGDKLDASKMSVLANLPMEDLTDFKHIQAPKDFNVKALKALLTLLGMQERLAASIQQGDDAVVRDMMDQLEKQVKSLVQGQQLLKDRLPLWGQQVLEEDEASTFKQRLDSAKQFLEALQRYNTPGKLKNLRETPEEIEAQQGALNSWQTLQQLEKIVRELQAPCSYLSQAQQILPEDHPWQDEVKAARTDLRQDLQDKEKRLSGTLANSTLARLEKLAQAYRDAYIKLYGNARLTLAQDKEKAALMHDDRLQTLDKLAGIELLQTASEKLSQWRNDWAQLKVAEAIDPKVLAMNPQPVDFSPRSERMVLSATDRLGDLDSELDMLLTQWTDSLADSLADPFLDQSLLKQEQQQLIQQFQNKRELPQPLSRDFIDAVNELFSGLEPVTISSKQLINTLGGLGTPLTTKELIERFTALVEESTKGKEKDKVRILFE